MQGWVEIGPVVLEEKISKFVNVFSLFRYYLPLEKGVVLYINKLERTSPKNILSQVWLKLAQWIRRRRFLNWTMYFCYFVMISPWKKVAFFIWKKKLESLSSKYLSMYSIPLENSGALYFDQIEYLSPKDAKLVEIGPVVLERKNFKFRQFIIAISLSFPLGKGSSSLFEQSWNYFNQGCFFRSLVDINPMVLEKIFQFWQCIFLFRYHLHFGKEVALYLNNIETTLSKDALCYVWLKLAHWF